MESGAVDASSESPFAAPLSRKQLHAISSKTNELIHKRSKIDKKLLREAKRDETSKPTLGDFPRRDNLIRKHTRLEEREKRHLARLSELEDLYTQHPSSDHAPHRDLVQQLHSKFKKLHGPNPEPHSSPGSERMDSINASQLLKSELPIDEALSSQNGEKRKSKKNHNPANEKHKLDTSDELEHPMNPVAEKIQTKDMKEANNGS
ncbi:hypothetical protein K449DRAFT_383929 [Hypoxylon sp. EC38]|nr:hypothetical protein K449DRAFT_383929 [Hypoxylon sp. EC38]